MPGLEGQIKILSQHRRQKRKELDPEYLKWKSVTLEGKKGPDENTAKEPTLEN